MGREDFRRFRESRIQLFSRMKLRNLLPGEWESVYAGKGIEFAAIKPFQPGDDLRDLHLQTLVRSGEEKILQRVVARQRRIYIWADVSGSTRRSEEMFFSALPDIRDIAIGLLLFSAWHAYSPVGICAFDQQICKFFPARSGERHCGEVLDWLIEEEYKGLRAPANLEPAISFLLEKASTSSLVFFVSDFQGQAYERDLTVLLRRVKRQVDLVPVVIRDPLMKAPALKKSVCIAVQDNEGGGNAEIYLTPQKLKEIQQVSAEHLVRLEQTFRQLGVEHIVLDSPSIDDCYRFLAGFFESRRRTRL